jgi:HAD superfamily hydrolase (TIGR01549 family)
MVDVPETHRDAGLMPRFDAVIFDWGNTIVDYPLRTPAEQIAFLSSFLRAQTEWLEDYAAADFGAKIADIAVLEAINAENGNLVVRAFTERVRTLLRDDAPAGVLADLERRLCDRIFASRHVIDGAADLLAATRRSARRLCILSNTPWGTSAAQWKNEVATCDFTRDVFDAIVFCGDVGHRKPHRSAFEYCLRTLGARPESTVMIGDSLTSDIIGAQQCGLSTLWVNRDHAQNADRRPAVERLEQVADHLGF